MTDIKSRIEEMFNYIDGEAKVAPDDLADLLEDCGNTIADLRAENDRLLERSKTLEYQLRNYDGFFQEKQREWCDENERLREALERISTGDLNYPEQAARKALKGETE